MNVKSKSKVQKIKMKNKIEKIVNDYLEYYPEEKDNMFKLIELINHNKENISNLFNRKNFEGHITASGFIYCLSEDKLLLLEHKSLNRFLQPGGHVEKDDSEMISTAKREILEETGIKDLESVSISDDVNVPFDINSHFIPANPKKQEDGHYHHDFRYLFVVDKVEDITIDYNESNDYKWVSVSDLLNDERFGLTIKKIVSLIEQNKRRL